MIMNFSKIAFLILSLSACAVYYPSDYIAPNHFSEAQIEQSIAACKEYADSQNIEAVNRVMANMQNNNNDNNAPLSYNTTCSQQLGGWNVACTSTPYQNNLASSYNNLGQSTANLGAAIAVRKNKQTSFDNCLKTIGYREKDWSEKETTISGIFTRGAYNVDKN